MLLSSLDVLAWRIAAPEYQYINHTHKLTVIKEKTVKILNLFLLASGAKPQYDDVREKGPKLTFILVKVVVLRTLLNRFRS